MTDLEAHADALVGFYRRLVDGNVDAQVAGVVTIDMNKAMCAGTVDLPKPDPKTERDAAAQAKAARRAEQLQQA